MSYQFSAAELTGMRAAQTGHMLDTGYLQTYSRTFDTFGQAVETWTESASSVACGLDMRPGSERFGPDKTVITYDATVRLSVTAAPNIKDRIRITKRFDESITAITFDIIGVIQRGPSGIRLLLNRIET